MESPTTSRVTEEDVLEQLNFDELNITSTDDDILDETEAAGHIQANLDDELVQEALRQGVDLRQYSRQIESELRKVELKSIEDYIRESRHIASLHYQIHNCDDILARMEEMLSKFQTDLGSISSEIQCLQDQSHSMSIKLKNRQAVRGELSQFVSNVTITEHLIQHITDTPVSEREFIENLHELDHKINFLNIQNFNDCRAVFDVRDVVDKLKIKSISKIREFLLQKIYQFRKPMTNYHMTQNQLLNYKYFNEFLMAHSRETAQQVRTEYLETMGKVYYSYFKDYYSKLMKLQFEETAEKDDLMGAEDSMKRGFFSTKTTLKNRSTIFTLGNRDTVLTTELEDPIIVVPHAQKGEKKYSYESLFRSVHFALMDNGCREYRFVVEFFNLTSSTAQDFFDSLFGKTLAYLLVSPSTNVTLLSITPACPSDLIIRWMTSDIRAVNGPTDIVQLIITLNNTDQKIFPYTASGEGEVRLTDLLLGTQYTITASLYSIHGNGPEGTPLSSTTLSEGLATPPRNLMAMPSSPSSILVSWQLPVSPNGDPNYIVTYRRADSEVARKNVSVEGLSTNVTGLDVFTIYDITVAANTLCGPSEKVSVSGVTGQTPPTSPLNLRVVATLPLAVVLEWNPPSNPNGAPLHYMVNCGTGPVVMAMTSHECSGLDADTEYEVTVAASNEAGLGPSIKITTRTACEASVPMVTSESGGPSVSLPPAPGGNCTVTRADYVLVVVQEVTSDPTRPLSSYTIEELVEATQRYARTRSRRQVRMETVYIAANVTENELRSDSFNVGDGGDYGDYTNHPLKPGVSYNIGVRGVVAGATTPLFDDSPLSPPSTYVPPTMTPEPPTFPLVIVAGSAGAAAFLVFAILLIACIICGCSYCNKRANKYIVANGGGEQRITRSSSFRLSGRKKSGATTDPVDEFRAHHRTEALEDHPPVPVMGFIQRLLVMKTNDNQLFLEEFGSINMTPQSSTEVADSNANRRRNRYNNILPYDNNRLRLRGHGSDYINASYCSGYMKNKSYISTQGPITETVSDFWRMVWDENIHTIIMLTNTSEKGKVKCETYWPRELGCSSIHGHMEVIMDQVTALADFTIRTFSLQKGSKESRQVKQFHFTSWPDHGVPQHATAMLSMLRRVRSYHSKVTGGPMLVHCSAGVGRTGTFIVIDSMLERLKNSDSLLDVYGHVSLLRTQRNYMVQTEDQYFFIYEALSEALLCGNTEITLEGLGRYIGELNSVVPGDQQDTTHIEVQFKRLASDRNDPYRYVTATKDANKHKNRLVNILPYETNRVVLEYLRGIDGSDYINASHIDSYHNRRAFIATQGPLASTVSDFWRMVWQYNSPVIVMLTETFEKGMERCAQYWPSEVLQSTVYDQLTVELAVERHSQHYTFRDLNITDHQTGTKRCVSHFQFHGWPEVGVPVTPSLMLDFIREVQKMYSSLYTQAPITVHCSSGVGRSGVYITLHITLERMKTEGLVDIFQTVKTLRIQRPAMVQTLQQYQFCYESALHYLESSDLLTQQRAPQPSAEVSRKRSFRHTPPSSQASPARAASTPSRKESFKGSARNFEAGKGAHIYGGSAATSTFGAHPTSGSQVALSGSQVALSQQGGYGGSQLSMGRSSQSPMPMQLGGSQSVLNVPPTGVHTRTGSMSGVPHQLAASQRYSTASVTGWTQ